MLAVAWQLFLAGITDIVIYSLDRVILAAYRSPAAVGLYEGAVRPHNVIRQLHGSLVLTVVPVASGYLADEDQFRVRELLLRGTRYVLAIVAPVTVALMVVSAPLLEVWLGERFRVAAPALAILASYWLVGGNTGVSGAMLVAAGRVRQLAWYAWLVAGVNFVLALVLTPLFGLEGVALAISAPYIFLFPIFFKLVRDAFPTATLRDFIREAWLPTYSLCAALALLLVGCRLVLDLDNLPELVAVVFGCLALYALAWAALFATPGERALVRSFCQATRMNGMRGLWIFDHADIAGGGQRFALRLARHAADSGRMDVQMVCPAGSALAHWSRDAGLPVTDADFPPFPTSPAIAALARTRRLLGLMRSDQLIVANSARVQAYLFAASRLRRNRARVVNLMHEQDSARRPSARYAYRRFGSLLVIGDAAARAYRERLPGLAVHEANNFLTKSEIAPFEALRADRSAPSGPPVLGTLARMIPEKGLVELVEELARRTARPLWKRLVLAAFPQDEAYERRLRARIGQLGLEDVVELVAPRPATDVLAGVDALIVPSTGHEAQPTAIIEALAAGVPVIVRAPLWSSAYAGLPVLRYASRAELAAALERLPPAPAEPAAIAARFGPEQFMAALESAGGSPAEPSGAGRVVQPHDHECIVLEHDRPQPSDALGCGPERMDEVEHGVRHAVAPGRLPRGRPGHGVVPVEHLVLESRPVRQCAAGARDRPGAPGGARTRRSARCRTRTRASRGAPRSPSSSSSAGRSPRHPASGCSPPAPRRPRCCRRPSAGRCRDPASDWSCPAPT